ncbi:type II toxin-antitoxin system HicB family antitoxin [Cognatilysobacter segetis]|uniref:type II toxin-antitoxin system HicB family antitoxin n=1 Tax=Cognatilysobacter segetis TaxID=2492394 RepID=UPI00138FCD19|nr:type II toxin-antitoxin system HicB family antitoxin [Lysobacter segetis]
MGYFAFVRRDADRRYHATLPDFPGCSVDATRLDALADAIRDAMRACVDGGEWPVPTRLEQLPRQDADHDGYWLMVEAGPRA